MQLGKARELISSIDEERIIIDKKSDGEIIVS